MDSGVSKWTCVWTESDFPKTRVLGRSFLSKNPQSMSCNAAIQVAAL
ncbi:hypothetical protein [Methanosarcina sp.]